MGKAIFSLIFISLFTLVGMTGAQNFISFTDDATTELAEVLDREENIIRTSVDSVSTTLLPGSRNFEVTLRNNGETKLADFALWDATVQYYDYLNNYHVFRLTYNEGEPGDNQWTVKGIYLDAANEVPELIEPGVLNPEEEIIIRGKLSPKAHSTNYGLAVIITPNGIKTWNHFSLQPLFLHNYPTPPADNTTAQAPLPMNLTAPTATVLYNYDTNYDNDPGRLIRQSRGLASESDLDEYQNWRIPATSLGGTGDVLEFDTVQGREPDIINISGDIYAVAYRGYYGYNHAGHIKTVEISSAGMITDTVIDTLIFDTVQGWEPDIIHVSGDIYAVAYHGDGDDGFLKTVKISSTGAITDTVIDTLEFDQSQGETPSIIHISGDIYAVAYAGYGNDGYLKTIEISSTGAITDTVIDTLEFDQSQGETPSIIHISGDIYAVAYSGYSDDGYIKTVEISSAGAITDTEIDTLEFDESRGATPDIIHISGDIYAVAYSGYRADGYIKTVEISSAGAITDTEIDTLEFDTTEGTEPDIIHVSGDIYAVAYYHYYGTSGLLKTIEILSDGTITDTAVDTMEYDTVWGMEPDTINVSGNTYGIAYQGDGDDGFLLTLAILPTGVIISGCEIDDDIDLTLWTGIVDFQQSMRGVVIVYLRDFDGSDYTEIASVTLDAADWQGGSDTWVEVLFAFSDVSYNIIVGHFLEVKVVVDDASDDDMWFAYDTVYYQSSILVP